MSEEYSVGYSEGYQAGWNAAMDATPPAQQAQQEPVAWVNKDDLGKFDMRVRTNCDYYHTMPLYTTPPAQEFVCSTGLCHYKAQRQPLTDDRIGQIIEQCQITLVNYCSGEKQTEFARAIEAEHGIKGES
jgi:hypothetical protein